MQRGAEQRNCLQDSAYHELQLTLNAKSDEMDHHYHMLSLIKDSAVLGAMFGVGVVLDEKALIPIGTLGAVCGMVWWLGRKLQRIEDQQEHILDKVNTLECVKYKNGCAVKEASKK